MATTSGPHGMVALLCALLVLGIVPFSPAAAEAAQGSPSQAQQNHVQQGETIQGLDLPVPIPKLGALNLPNVSTEALGIPLDAASFHENFMSMVDFSLRCDTIWEGPSAKNDILQCVSNVDYLKKNWRGFVIPGFSLLLFVLLLVFYPLLCLCVMCCRRCCRPKARRSMMTARCCIWMWIIYALLCNLLVLVLIISGAQLLVTSFPELVKDFESGPLHYFNTTAETLLNFMSDWSTGERKPLPGLDMDLTPFYTVQDQVRNTLDEVRETFFSHIDTISIATYCIGAVGFVLVLLIVPFAFLRCCIPFFPFVISLVYWIFGLIFTLLGAVLIVGSLAFAAGCGEIELQYRRQPGVFQWYVVPFCEELVRFEDIHKTVHKKEVEMGGEACKNLLKACDNVADTGGAVSAVPAGGGSVSNLLAQVADVQDVGVPGLPGGAGLGGLAAAGALGGAGLGGGGGGAGGPTDLASLVSRSQNSGSGGSPLGAGASGIPGNLAANLPGGLGGKLPVDLSKGIPEGFQEKLAANFPNGLPADLPKSISPEMIANFDASKLSPQLQTLLQAGLSGASFKPLSCGGGIQSAEECGNFDTLAHVLMESRVKAFVSACPRQGESCDVVECAFNCSVPFVTNIAVEIMQGALQARNATIALSYAKPLLEWNFMIDKVAGSMKRCNDFRLATLMMGSGFVLGGVTFCLAIYIALRGACIWTGKGK